MVWIVTETYRYEDERGGIPVAVFDSQPSALADCEARRNAPARNYGYEYDVVEWEVSK